MAPRKPKPEPALLEMLKAQLLAAITDARLPDANGRTQPSAVAALSKELRAVQAEMDKANQAGEVSKADVIRDDLAAKRSARGADPADRASTSRRSQPRRGNSNHRAG